VTGTSWIEGSKTNTNFKPTAQIPEHAFIEKRERIQTEKKTKEGVKEN